MSGANPVLWRHKHPVTLPRPRTRAGAWVARGLLGVVLTLAALGLARVPWPWPERADADVWLVVTASAGEESKAVQELAEHLRRAPGVASVEVRPDAGLAETELEQILARAPGRPQMVLLVRPATEQTDPQAWLKLAERCRAAGVSVGAIATPPEARPGVTVALPRRQAPLAEGRYGTLAVAVGNLDRLAGKPRLEVLVHGDKAALDPKALNREFGELLSPGPLPEGGPVKRFRLALDAFPWPTSTAGSDHAAARRNLTVQPLAVDDLISGPAEGVEGVLSEGDRVVARSYSPVDRTPPRSLYVSLATLCVSDRTRDHFVPHLPQRLRAGGRYDRLPWNLVWGADKEPGGLEVYWPPSRPRPEEIADRNIRTELVQDVEQMLAYRAVILDASVPAGLDSDFRLADAADPGDPGQSRWTDVASFGGFLSGPASDPRGAPVSASEWRKFCAALVAYWKRGGTVIVVGGHPSCFDERLSVPGADDFLTLRDLLKTFAAPLGEFEPGQPPRRVVLAYDDTEAAAKAAMVTLPPLDDAGVAAPDRPSSREQCHAVFADLPEADGRWPGRVRLNADAAARLRLAADGSDADREFATALRGVLPDSQAEFASLVAQRLAERFRHPGLAVELQGRPAFRCCYPACDDPDEEPVGLAFALPFRRGPDERAGPALWRDRYRTLYRRLKAGPADPVQQALRDRPRLKSGPLVDGLNAERFTQYLHEQIFSADAAPGRHVVLGFFPRGRFESDRAARGDAQWPLLSPDGPPFPRQTKAFHSIPAQPGEHFVYLGPGTAPEPDKALEDYFQGPFAVTPADWWSVRLGPPRADDDLARRLLFMGRGRFVRLLEAALARDVQSLPCRTDDSLGKDVAALGGVAAPEAIDTLRRVVHERVRLSATPALKPKLSPGGWRPLVVARDGGREVPVVVAAAAPAGGGKLVLALFDPGYEAELHRLRAAALGDWTDFAATSTFVGGRPRRMPAGFRLRSVPLGHDAETVAWRLTAHAVRAEGPPYPLEEAPTAWGDVEVAVRAHPHLGLAGAGNAWLAVDASPTKPEAELRPVAAKESRPVAVPAEGLVLTLPRGSQDALAHALGYPTGAGAPLAPPQLPPLLEFRLTLRKDGQAHEASVFAPLPPPQFRVQEQHRQYSGSLGYAPPTTVALDLLAEVLGRPSRYDVEAGADGVSVRIRPAPDEPFVIRPDAPGSAPLPAGDFAVARTLPGQAVVRFAPRGGGVAGPMVVEFESPGRPKEEHRFYLPGPLDSGAARPVELTPAEAAVASPPPEDLVLDTLAAATMPETLRRRLDDPATSAGDWGPAERGVLVCPLTPAQAPALRRFAERFVEERTTTAHHRAWFLWAAVALALAAAARRL